MRFRFTICLLLLAGLLPAALSAQEKVQARDAWGRFTVGSWKRVRIRKQTFADGMLAASSVEESKTTLKAADDDQYTLDVDSVLKVAGQEIKNSKSISLTYYGSRPGHPPEVKSVSQEAAVALEGRSIKCRLQEVTVTTDDHKWVSRRHLSDIHDAPLRVETTVVDRKNESIVIKTLSEVRARNLLHIVLGEQRQAALVQTVLEQPATRQTTFELHCPDVPGGVVASWSKVTDKEGRLTERLVLELVDFGVPSDTP